MLELEFRAVLHNRGGAPSQGGIKKFPEGGPNPYALYKTERFCEQESVPSNSLN